MAAFPREPAEAFVVANEASGEAKYLESEFPGMPGGPQHSRLGQALAEVEGVRGDILDVPTAELQPFEYEVLAPK